VKITTLDKVPADGSHDISGVVDGEDTPRDDAAWWHLTEDYAAGMDTGYPEHPVWARKHQAE
jgi:hypothetical protein